MPEHRGPLWVSAEFDGSGHNPAVSSNIGRPLKSHKERVSLVSLKPRHPAGHTATMDGSRLPFPPDQNHNTPLRIDAMTKSARGMSAAELFELGQRRQQEEKDPPRARR